MSLFGRRLRFLSYFNLHIFGLVEITAAVSGVYFCKLNSCDVMSAEFIHTVLVGLFVGSFGSTSPLIDIIVLASL